MREPGCRYAARFGGRIGEKRVFQLYEACGLHLPPAGSPGNGKRVFLRHVEGVADLCARRECGALQGGPQLVGTERAHPAAFGAGGRSIRLSGRKYSFARELSEMKQSPCFQAVFETGQLESKGIGRGNIFIGAFFRPG